MHILTKIFVLIASILAVAMSALAVSYTVNADRIVQDYKDALAATEAAEAASAAERAQNEQRREQLAAEIEQLRQSLATGEGEMRALEAQLASARSAEREARDEASSISGKISQLGVAVQTQSELIDSYKDEVTSLRADELRFRDERLDLEDRLADLQSQVLVYEQTNRALREQLTEAQRAAQGGAVATRTTGTTASSPKEILGPVVRGQVLETRRDPATGDLLVRIDLGSNDRVRDNVRLYLARGGSTYLGDVVVLRTDLNFAIGRVTNLRPGMEVRSGDAVLTRLAG